MSAKTGQKTFPAYCLETYTPGAAFVVKIVTVLAVDHAHGRAKVRDNTGAEFYVRFGQLSSNWKLLAQKINGRFPLSTDATHGSPESEPLSQKMAGAAASA